jgi:hypothetical protein
MKISIVFTEGAKQIMMTPETDHEKQALKYIAPDDELKVVSQKWGSFVEKREHVDYQVAKCQGGYYRLFNSEDSLMFVIEKSQEK